MFFINAFYKPTLLVLINFTPSGRFSQLSTTYMYHYCFMQTWKVMEDLSLKPPLLLTIYCMCQAALDNKKYKVCEKKKKMASNNKFSMAAPCVCAVWLESLWSMLLLYSFENSRNIQKYKRKYTWIKGSDIWQSPYSASPQLQYSTDLWLSMEETLIAITTELS